MHLTRADFADKLTYPRRVKEDLTIDLGDCQIFVCEIMSVDGDLTIIGEPDDRFGPSPVHFGFLTVTGNMSVPGETYFSGDATIGGRLAIGSSLDVDGKVTVQDLEVTHDVRIKGLLRAGTGQIGRSLECGSLSADSVFVNEGISVAEWSRAGSIRFGEGYSYRVGTSPKLKRTLALAEERGAAQHLGVKSLADLAGGRWHGRIDWVRLALAADSSKLGMLPIGARSAAGGPATP